MLNELISLKESVLYLLFSLILFWGYCLYQSIAARSPNRSIEGFLLGGRNLSYSTFIFFSSVVSLSAWALFRLPEWIFHDGFPASYFIFTYIAVSLAGALLMRRQWLISHRFKFVSPGEMYGHYFQSRILRFIPAIITLFLAFSFVAFYLYQSSRLLNSLSGGWVTVTNGYYLFSALLFIHINLGGLRAIAKAGALQWLLFLSGLVTIALITTYLVGGFEQFFQNLAKLALVDSNLTPEGYSHYLAFPEITIGEASITSIFFTPTVNYAVIFAGIVALIGIQTNPAFSILAFANKRPSAFDAQQVWVSVGITGGVIIFSVTLLAFGMHFLGANDVFSDQYGTPAFDLLKPLSAQVETGNSASVTFKLFDQLILLTAEPNPWISGLLFVAVISALQASASLFLLAAAGMLTQDLIKPLFKTKLSYPLQRLIFCLILIILLAVITYFLIADIFYLPDLLIVAITASLQLLPALIAMCWWPFLTTISIKFGLLSGLLATAYFYFSSHFIELGEVEIYLLTYGFFALLVNFTTAIIISFNDKNSLYSNHQKSFHHIIDAGTIQVDTAKSLIPLVWVLVTIWCFFAIGPGVIIGNSLFGDPMNYDSWLFGIPSIWLWQIIWWLIGIFLLWIMIYKVHQPAFLNREAAIISTKKY